MIYGPIYGLFLLFEELSRYVSVQEVTPNLRKISLIIRDPDIAQKVLLVCGCSFLYNILFSLILAVETN